MSKVAGGDFCSVVSTVPKCKRGPTHKRWIFTATQLWIAEINYLHITSEGPFAHLLKFYLVKQGMDRPHRARFKKLHVPWLWWETCIELKLLSTLSSPKCSGRPNQLTRGQHRTFFKSGPCIGASFSDS